MSALSNVQITALALNNGFKMKVQSDGALGLNPYVFEFARALLASQAPTVGIMAAELPVVGWMTEDGRIATAGTKNTAMASTSKVNFNIPLVRADQVERYVAALLQVAQIEAQQAALAAVEPVAQTLMRAGHGPEEAMRLAIAGRADAALLDTRPSAAPVGQIRTDIERCHAVWFGESLPHGTMLYTHPQPSAENARDAARWRFSAASCVTGSPEESIMSEIGNEWPDEDDTIRTSGEFTRFIDACMVALKDRQ